MAYETVMTLCGNVPLDPRYEHTLTFPSRTLQRAYFDTLAAYTQMANLSYLRKEHAICVDLGAEALENAGINYLYTVNDSKVRYYFITDKEYLSDDVTRLHVELDVLQTYQFDWSIPACFVEREHVDDDTPGAHLLDEGLELGEYTNNSTYTYNLSELAIIIQSSVSLQNDPGIGEAISGTIIGNVYSGLALYTRTLNATSVLVIDAIIKALDAAGKTDAIQSMWVYPKALVLADWDYEDEETVLKVVGVNAHEIMLTGNTSLDGYAPRNNKLLTYPYNFLYCHNHMGECAFYPYERFTGDIFGGDAMTFQIVGNIGSDGTARIIPRYYNGLSLASEEGLSLTGFPTCAWTQDAYKIWMAQNANTQALSIQSGMVSVGIGAGMVAAGGVQAAIPLGEGGGTLISSGMQQAYSGYQQIAGVMAARKDAQVQPPQAKGAQSSSCNIAISDHEFTFLRKSIRAEFAQRIDSFFDLYGYKVNQVKVPNVTGRAGWNYVKTIGCVVNGNIDANDRRRIAAIFDKGVTFWHNYTTMYDYSASNGVV